MSQHARLAPSNTRWPYCPGSVREESQYPDIAGEAAIDGTGTHLLVELCLQNNVLAVQYDQQIIGVNNEDQPNGWLIAPDRIERAQMCLDYVTRRVKELKELFPGCNVLVESESHSDPGSAFGRDDWSGTCDITITARHPMTCEIYFIEVCDYKDGRGYVSEKDNTQLTAYLFGKMLKYIEGKNHNGKFNHLNVQGCRMTIVQPKTNPVVRYQCSTRGDITVKSVIDRAKQLAIYANETDDPNAPLKPGKHCQWCKANPKRGGHCTAATDQSLKVVENMTTETAGQLIAGNSGLQEYFSAALTDPKSLTVDQLAEIADAESGIQAVFDKVRTEIQTRLEQEIPVPGYAMVPGKGSNVYSVSDEEVEKKLKACRLKKGDIYPSKLISPAQLMKLPQLTDDQKTRLEKELIKYVGGKLTLKQVAKTEPDAKDPALMFADVPASSDPDWVVDATIGEDQPEEVSFF